MVIQCKGCVWEYAEHNARFSVVPAGKSGTTWKHISADTDGHIHQCTSGVATKNSFDVVLVVLGTKDIPTTKQWDKQREPLKLAMQCVIRGLLGYLKEGVLEDQLIISRVFNCEPDRATTGFTHLLQEVAQRTGTHFLNVPWSEAEHSQTKTKTPQKHFNEVGVQLLCHLLFSVIEFPLPVSGGAQLAQGVQSTWSDSTPLQPPKAATSTRRLPTLRQNSPHGSSSCSSSSACSSTTSHQSSKVASHCDAPHEKEGMVCEVCQTINHHTIDSCPLVMACMFDGDAAAASTMLSQLDKRYRPQGRESQYKSVAFGSYQVIRCPPDGNCLFTALLIGQRMVQGKIPVVYSERAAAGCACRLQFLTCVETMMNSNAQLAGLCVKTLLVDTGRWQGPEEYMATMRSALGCRRQWGGYAEAACVASLWKLDIFFFVLHSDMSLTLTCEPIRPNGAQGSVCLLWTGTHYDLLRFEPGVLAEATQCAGFAGEVQAATSVVAAAASDAAAA